MISADMVRRMTETRGVRLSYSEVQVIGRLAEYYLTGYEEQTRSVIEDTGMLGTASMVYGLYHKMAGRAIRPQSHYVISFGPGERKALRDLLDLYDGQLGVYERTVSYRLRDELKLI